MIDDDDSFSDQCEGEYEERCEDGEVGLCEDISHHCSRGVHLVGGDGTQHHQKTDQSEKQVLHRYQILYLTYHADVREEGTGNSKNENGGKT